VRGEAFVFSAHFTSYDDTTVNRAERHAAGTRQPQCGALAFDNGTDSMVLRYRLGDPGPADWHYWVRRSRRDNPGAQGLYQQDTMKLFRMGAPGNDTTFYMYAPRVSNYDMVAFGFQHGADSATVVNNDFDADANAAAQLWETIATPNSFHVALEGTTIAHVSWTKMVQGRSIDSTLIYRRVGGGSWGTNPYRSVHGNVENFYDSSLALGQTYYYFLRHATGTGFPAVDAQDVVMPVSRSTYEDSVLVPGTPPPPSLPLPLACEGNFDATIDCNWQNTTVGAETQIFRDGGGSPIATLSAGVTTWTDQAVDSGVSYRYTFRHRLGGVPGDTVGTTGVALPVPPENLSCGGTSTSTATCVWINKENTQTQVWRRRGNKPQYTLVATLSAGVDQLDDSGLDEGVTYTYKTRHISGSEYTAWSNTDEATPGSIPEPYRPGKK